MTLIAVADACRLLALDPKTLRRWLAQAHVPLQPHPSDARSKVLTAEHLRQVAAAHRRTLADLPASVPASQPPPAPWADLLAGLSAQLVLLQQRVAELTQVLHDGQVSAPSCSQESAARRSEPVAASAPAPATASSAQPLAKPARVLPLVEYGTDAGYVVICPTHGRLTLEPDSPQWFAWLATQSSFRFVGQSGRLTVHREVQRLPGAAWRAHRHIRNHSYNLHLGSTESLTMAALEQAAAALQAYLT